ADFDPQEPEDFDTINGIPQPPASALNTRTDNYDAFYSTVDPGTAGLSSFDKKLMGVIGFFPATPAPAPVLQTLQIVVDINSIKVINNSEGFELGYYSRIFVNLGSNSPKGSLSAAQEQDPGLDSPIAPNVSGLLSNPGWHAVFTYDVKN